jgi:hypothetical protein
MHKENEIVNGDRPVRRRSGRGRIGALLAAGLLALAAAATGAPSASAADFVTDFDVVTSGPQATQAGGHPDVTARVVLGIDPTGGYNGSPVPAGDIRDMTIDLPAGFVGDPSSAPACAKGELARVQCPTAAQIGLVTLALSDDGSNTQQVGLYNLEPSAGNVAELGFNLLGLGPVVIVASLRPEAGYTLRLRMRDLPTQILPPFAIDTTLWGVPGDPSHDTQRTRPGEPAPSGDAVPSGAPLRAFTSNPVACTGQPLATKMTTRSWQQPGVPVTLTASSPPLEGCDGVRFDATATAQPTSLVAGQPTGLRVEIDVPQETAPYGISVGQLRRAEVRLPAGMQISPSAADGLLACSDAQIGLGSDAPVACPRAAQIGTLAIDTPLLDEPLTGEVYVGAPLPGNPYRLFLAARGGGVLLKLAGAVAADPRTGQLTAVFDDNPQMPFRHLTLTLFGGPRAVLANPPACGTFTTQAALTPWSGAAPATSSDSFTLSTGCAPLPFSPFFRAGTTSQLAGAFTPFLLDVGRRDLQPDLRRVAVTLPPGLLARIATVPLCPEAAANAGACAAASRVGSVTAAAGPGPSPFELPGAAYLTGGYGGGAYGLSIVVDATRAGPYDLGKVVVRAAIHVDPRDAHLTAISDELPTILQGIPLRIRAVRLSMDRPGFTFNPTRCTTMQVRGALTAANGATSEVASRFRVNGCRALGYRPRLSLTVASSRRPQPGQRLAFTAVLTQPPGQANNRGVTVTLPATINSRIAALETQCAIEAFEADRCPRGSRVGTASAVTPVLSEPLRGSVHFVKNSGRGLPRLMVALKGAGLRIELRGDVTTPGGRLRTRFAAIPDAPVTRFRLALTGGANAPLSVAARSLCRRDARTRPASIAFAAQSGKRVTVEQPLRVRGCGRRG